MPYAICIDLLFSWCSQADLHLPKDAQGRTDFAGLVRQLRTCPTLQDQADILYVLYVMKYVRTRTRTRHNHTHTDTLYFITP